MKLVGGDAIVTNAGRAKMWIFAGALVGLLAGAGWYFASAPYYRARSVIELSELPSTISLQPGGAPARAVSIDTDAQIVVGDAVAEAVAEAVGSDREAARRSMRISARPLTRVLVVTYSGSSADEARTGAGAAAEAFLAERERLLVGPVRDWLLEVAETQEQQATAVTAVTAPTDPTAVTATTEPTEQTRIFPRPVLDNRRRRAVEASLALPGPGRTLEASVRTPTVERGQAELPLVSGTALGALLGLGAGIARVRRKEGEQAVIAAKGRAEDR